MPSHKKLTALDILQMAVEAQAGSGYLGHACRDPRYWLNARDPYSVTHSLDQAVADVANTLKLSREAVFTWASSKDGRWLGDTIMGQSQEKFFALIHRSMTGVT